MFKRKVLTALAITTVMLLGALASAEALDLGQGEFLYWTGGATTQTDTFEAEGRWKLTLGATCFEGIGFVQVLVYDAEGEQVGRVRVLGEGVESVVLDPGPGEYYLDVFVSNFHVYTWEVVIEHTDEALSPEPDWEPATIPGATDHSGHAPSTADLAAAGADPSLQLINDTKMVNLPNAWVGEDNFTTERFEVGGEWEIALGAWCHDGVSFVRVTAFTESGELVDEVTVIGQGVVRKTLVTEPGVYYLEVWSPDMDVYNWDLAVQPLSAAAAEEPAAEEPASQEPEATAPASYTAPLSGVVEISMNQVDANTFFDPVGVWVEPGTTIRFVLTEGVHDSRAYHPANSVGFSRIPEGAEPWDSGLLGGLLDTVGFFEVTLTVEGVYDYFCLPHHALGMVGRIVVGDPNASPARPVDEIPFEAARLALPSVEEILENFVVAWEAP